MAKSYEYYIEVGVKDARTAQDIYKDGSWKRMGIAQTSTNYYESNDEENIIEFLTELQDQDLEIYDTNIEVEENATGGSVNGMGAVILPTGDEEGSGDIPAKKKKVRKIKDILAEMDDEEDKEELELDIELTEEQAKLIVNILMNPDMVNESELSQLDEGILGSILGGVGGFAFGKSIGKLLADTLGIKEKSPLYNVLTSRLVATAIGAALGKKLNI